MHFVRNKITFADNKGLISEIQRLTDYTMAKRKRTKDKPLLTQKRPIQLQLLDTTDAVRSASYIDIHLIRDLFPDVLTRMAH
jgi:hypothetical protein